MNNRLIDFPRFCVFIFTRKKAGNNATESMPSIADKKIGTDEKFLRKAAITGGSAEVIVISLSNAVNVIHSH